MEFRNTLAMTASALLITLTGCGGGGGGGAPAEQPRAPATPTTLPIFLQSQIDKCSFVENGAPVALAGYSGTLSAVTELNCADTQFANFDEIELLSGMTALRLTNANLTSVDALQGLTQLTLLDVSNNALTDLTTISNLMSLQNLNLANNNIADLSPLTALLALTELRLSGNELLKCPDVFNLKAIIESTGTGNVIIPAQCGVSLTLRDSSVPDLVINNALEETPYDRVQFVAPYIEQNVALFVVGEDLKVQLNSAEGPRSVTFTGWFTDRENTVATFGFAGDKEYTFRELQELVGLSTALTEMDDVFEGTSNADIVYGLGGNDVIFGNSGADIIQGGKGDDIIFGHWGSINDDGSISINTSSGETGKDIIIFNLGDGNDTVAEHEIISSDRSILKFGTGISADNIQLSRVGYDLKLSFTNSPTDSVTIYNWFFADGYTIGTIQFGATEPVDANTWVINKGFSSANGEPIEGSSGDDTINGSDGNDVIFGNSGADIIQGGKGDDIIFGHWGSINDDGSIYINTSSGETGKDIIIFNLGDGNDTVAEHEIISSDRSILKFGTGISADNIQLSRVGYDLKLSFTNSPTDSVTIYNWFFADDYTIGTIQFGAAEPVDANTWVINKGFSSANGEPIEGSSGDDTINGSDGNDVIFGNNGADIIQGGKGDDIIFGHWGSINDDGSIYINTGSGETGKDIIIFNLGDGNDTVAEHETTTADRCILKFGTGISADNIQLSRVGYDLKLSFTNSPTDSVTIYNWFFADGYTIGSLQFEGQEPLDAVTFVESKM